MTYPLSYIMKTSRLTRRHRIICSTSRVDYPDWMSTRVVAIITYGAQPNSIVASRSGRSRGRAQTLLILFTRTSKLFYGLSIKRFFDANTSWVTFGLFTSNLPGRVTWYKLKFILIEIMSYVFLTNVFSQRHIPLNSLKFGILTLPSQYIIDN